MYHAHADADSKSSHWSLLQPGPDNTFMEHLLVLLHNTSACQRPLNSIEYDFLVLSLQAACTG